MFNKTKIATAVVAAACGTIGVANTAHAVQLNNDQSQGQVMILPYYNVNNNFTTSLAITNTTAEFKAVKIRFRESGDSQDVLDFNIYLSPFDQWDAAIRLNTSTGVANIVTTDKSCTFPDGVAAAPAGQDFIDAYDNIDADDISEGYVEIFEMGVIADGAGPAADLGLCAQLDGDGSLFTCSEADDEIIVDLIEHGEALDAPPADCGVVTRAWDEGGDLPLGRGGFTRGALEVGAGLVAGGRAIDEDPTVPYSETGAPNPLVAGLNGGLVAPTGGLNAFAILINNETGAAFVKEAEHITNYSTVQQHYEPDDVNNYLLPSLASGDVVTSSWLNDAGNAAVQLAWPLTTFDTGAFTDIAPNPRIPAGANPFPVAAVLTAAAIGNDYFLDPVISGSSDWVVAFPMKKHNIWNGMRLNIDIDGNATLCLPGISPQGFVKWPVTPVECDDENAGFVDDTAHEGEGIVYDLVYYDREETIDRPDPEDHIPSPPTVFPPGLFEFNREVNVMTFARSGESPDSVLGTPSDNVVTQPIEPGFITGWARLDFGSAGASYEYSDLGNALDDLANPVTDGDIPWQLYGLPTTGFAALEGEIGPASVGETLNHMKFHIRRQVP